MATPVLPLPGIVPSAADVARPLGRRDILGRTVGTFASVAEPVAIAPNKFEFKSLSNWAVNLAIGCSHGCRFCYVPSALRMGSTSAQSPGGGLVVRRFTASQLAQDGTPIATLLRDKRTKLRDRVVAAMDADSAKELRQWAQPVRPSRRLLAAVVEALNRVVATHSSPSIEGRIRAEFGAGLEAPRRGLRERLQDHGVQDPDLDWGSYVLLRPWVPEAFRKSLVAADTTPDSALNPDGNRAVMYCSTTDPFQHYGIQAAANGWPPTMLNTHSERIIVESLSMIRDESKLRVRILTRGQPSDNEWQVLQSFNGTGRLLFGVSLPTLTDAWRQIYEPHAPKMEDRLATLELAAEKGIPVYVAMAPTYPECDADDIRKTLRAIKKCNPLTVFCEPINLRAENVARMAAHAAKKRFPFRREVFSPENWPSYAVQQLVLVQRIAEEEGVLDRLHPWPDKALLSDGVLQRVVDAAPQSPGIDSYGEYREWIQSCHRRISEWPQAT